MPIFRVKSVKIYTSQKKITRAPLVVLVTNISYDCHHHHLIMEHLVQGKEWPVLGEDKVVVPPPVVPAVSQLEHVQDA